MSYRRWSDEQLSDAVKDSTSVSQVLKLLKLNPTGANYKGIKNHCVRLGLSTLHFTGQGHLKGRSHDWSPKLPWSEVLVQESTYLCTSSLKRRLLKDGLLVYACSECGISEWRGEPLSLVLDHINGVNNDNRMENLRLLCPNCNSQQPTFAGRNKKK